MIKNHRCKYHAFTPQLPSNQVGAALIMTLVVLTALTVVALSVASGNQTQSIMVRNSQFRLEAFNVSLAEIDAQVDDLNKRKLSDGPPNWMNHVLDGEPGERVYSGSAESVTQLPFLSDTPDDFMEKEVAQVFRGNCIAVGFQLGVGKSGVLCNEVIIESEAQLEDTSIDSNQRQVYEYLTPN